MNTEYNDDLEDYEINVGGVYLLVRRDDALTWRRSNPILGKAELGYDFTHRAFKRGDGVTPWRQLPWFAQVVMPDA